MPYWAVLVSGSRRIWNIHVADSNGGEKESSLGILTVLVWSSGANSEWKERFTCGVRAGTAADFNALLNSIRYDLNRNYDDQFN